MIWRIMMRSLVLKTLYDRRWFVFGWSLGTLGMVWLVVGFYPSFSEGDTLEQLTKSLPEQFKAFIGDAALLKTVPGYLAEQILNFRVTLLLMIMAMILGSSLTVADEERGTLRTVLATPLSRFQIVSQKWLAGVIIMLSVSFSTILGIYIGLASIGERADNGLIWAVFLLCWLFGLAALSVPFGLGLGTGNRAVTMTVSTMVVVGSFILSTFGKAVGWLEPVERFSLMHYFDATAVARDGLIIGDVMVFIAVIIVMVTVGLFGFRRRDAS